jgi:putative hydrolase
VSEFPFGFGKPGDPDEPGGRGSGSGGSGSGGSGGSGGAGGSGGQFGPGGFGFGALGDLGGTEISEALHRFADMMAWQGGPVNWDLARDVARQAAAAAGDDPSIGPAERSAVADAIRLAELWLDPTTSFSAATTSATAWSRAEWIEATLPTWKTLVEPVAAKVVDAFGGGLTGGLSAGLGGTEATSGAGDADDDPDGDMAAQMQQMAGPLLSMMRQMGGVMFGGQVGQALGTLSTEVVSSTDVGIPLAGVGNAALIPAGIAAFGEGLGIEPEEVRLFIALREAACHRLFAGVPWLRGRLLNAVDEYARGITIDTSRIQEAFGSIDPTQLGEPGALQEALTGGLFEPENTPAQQVALGRLETLLALVEGWIDDVVGQAADGRLTSAAALGETVRRRRAAGGPAEQTFGTLVGLQLRPRRMREAAELWRLLREDRGTDGRDALWEHPDLLPTADDLEDPAAFVNRRDVDLDLRSLDDTPPDDSAGREGR